MTLEELRKRKQPIGHEDDLSKYVSQCGEEKWIYCSYNENTFSLVRGNDHADNIQNRVIDFKRLSFGICVIKVKLTTLDAVESLLNSLKYWGVYPKGVYCEGME